MQQSSSHKNFQKFYMMQKYRFYLLTNEIGSLWKMVILTFLDYLIPYALTLVFRRYFL